MKTSVTGFPRIGALRELKFITERYWKGEAGLEELETGAKNIRSEHWRKQFEEGIDHIPSNDFSFYDNMLDTSVLLNAIPVRYKDLGFDSIDTYFAMARGYQGEAGDVKALAMKKWFNTNYHYLVPEIQDDTKICVAGTKPFDEFKEAGNIGIKTKPVIIGPFTFLKLTKYTGSKCAEDFCKDFIAAYIKILENFKELGAEWVQFDEPFLVTDLNEEDIQLFTDIYSEVLNFKGDVKVLLQTYFGDIRDCYERIIGLKFDGIGLDFTEGLKTRELLEKFGFPQDKILFAGLISGKNIWKNNYAAVLSDIGDIKKITPNIVIGTSCSLLHVPYTLEYEENMAEEKKQYFAFAYEKLSELKELAGLAENENSAGETAYAENQKLFSHPRDCRNEEVQKQLNDLSDKSFTRIPAFGEREKIQKDTFSLPILPITTIGSFPQTEEVRISRAKLRRKELAREEYDAFIKSKIAGCIKLQEDIGIDVLVHGEFERSDMVEYFGENLDGCMFTKNAWVQSYGTRCVKPPIIWGDISRKAPITVSVSSYAQSLTTKPVKGMLTGPVTILNWSFPREDISLKEAALQIALAIREEVLDLESNGIRIIQVDEAALKEKLPLRRGDWHSEYLDWAISAFRLVHSGVRPDTQIHTHMCYSEFEEIIQDIDNMDADVISFEASRSSLSIINALNAQGFRTQTGPGVYDIHSPRVPSAEEIQSAIFKMLDGIPKEKLWINPDCGLKTRGEKETFESLKNMADAAKNVRRKIVNET